VHWNPEEPFLASCLLSCLQLGGLVCTELNLHLRQRTDILADLTTGQGVEAHLHDGAGLDPAAASLLDAPIVASLLCDKRAPSLVPLWPSTFCPLPKKARAFCRLPTVEAVGELLGTLFNEFVAVYFYVGTLESDPMWSGKMSFSTFDGKVFDERLGRGKDTVRKWMHEYMPPAPATPIMIVGASSDVVGDAELTGFFDITTHMLHMSKHYVRTDHPRSLNWIYRGRLFAFGFAGRWSTKGLVETQGGPFIIMPKCADSVKFLQRF
jgi:hypothetical protein